jgi:hypothetical protein
MAALPALIVSLIMLTVTVIFAFLHTLARQETPPEQLPEAVEIETTK